MEQRPQNQYDFITSKPPANKKSLFPGGNSMKARILIFGGGALLLIIVSVLFISFLSKAGKANVEALELAAIEQNELIRIAELGIEGARTQAVKDIATTTKLSMSSQQPQMLAALQSAGRKLSQKQLAAGEDNKVDQALTTAAQNNRFDEEFLKIIGASLTEYQQVVERAYEGAKDPEIRESLKTQFNSANVLAGQIAGVAS